MTKKIKILIIIFGVVLLVGIGVFIYYKNKNTNTEPIRRLTNEKSINKAYPKGDKSDKQIVGSIQEDISSMTSNEKEKIRNWAASMGYTYEYGLITFAIKRLRTYVFDWLVEQAASNQDIAVRLIRYGVGWSVGVPAPKDIKSLDQLKSFDINQKESVMINYYASIDPIIDYNYILSKLTVSDYIAAEQRLIKANSVNS